MGLFKCDYFPWIQSESAHLVLYVMKAAQLFPWQAALDIEVKDFKLMRRIKDVLSLIMTMFKLSLLNINITSPVLIILLCRVFLFSLYGKKYIHIISLNSFSVCWNSMITYLMTTQIGDKTVQIKSPLEHNYIQQIPVKWVLNLFL